MTELKQPPVTRKNVENELDYWLTQLPPHQLLEIIADKFDEMGRTGKGPLHKRMEFAAIGEALSGIQRLAFHVWNATH